MNNNNNSDFFFWLGADGETFELTEEEFVNQVKKQEKKQEDWLSVRWDNEGYVD